MPNYVPGVGNPSAKLMFVGEAPGKSEDFAREPFVGPTGQLLDEICREIGLERSSLYITNVIKYRPPDNKLYRLKEIGINIEDCIAQLWDEINTIKPNCIVGFGNLALKALAGKGNGFKGIMNWRGSVLKSVGLDYKVVPTIHPAALLHSDEELGDDRKFGEKKKGPLSYSYRHILKLDLLRAVEESQSNLYDPPSKVVEIARDAVSLQRFLDVYEDRVRYPYVSVDIEVVRSIPFCIALAFNNWHAISIPLLNIFEWQNIEGIHEHQLAEMWMIVAQLLDSKVKVIGQNFKFDQRQLSRLCWMHVRNFYCDTSLLAHSIHAEFPKSLAFLTSIYTKQAYYKDEGKEFDWKKDKIERILNYNGLDACVTFEVFEQLSKDAQEMIIPGFPNWSEDFARAYTTELHEFYYDLEDVGFKVDVRRGKELVKIYEARVAATQKALNDIAGWEVNVGSPKHMAQLVYNQFKFPVRKGTSEEILVALMANTKKMTPEMKRALELALTLRREKLSLKKNFKAKADYDGRMRTVYRIAGTETGRSSTAILQPPVRPEKIGMPFHTMTKHGDVGTEIREKFIADDGYVIVETDMSQAEARIVALLGEDAKQLEMFAKKIDVHKVTAAMIFGVDIQIVNKGMRFIGKTCRHAGNYDMRKHRFMELVNTEAKRQHIDVNLSEWKAGKYLETFHGFSPSIRGVFHLEVQRALENNNRILVNPFGRYRQFFDRWGEGLFKEAYAHIPQSTVPDHLRLAGLRAKDRFRTAGIDARFVVEAHDALVSLVRIRDVDKYVKIIHEEIEVPIDFSHCTIRRGSLVIPAETKLGMSYKTCDTKGCNTCAGMHDYVFPEAA